jgi:hypothetical protein
LRATDIVWQFANGQGGAWLMNGNAIVGASSIGGINGAQFQIRDLADLNGDAMMDIVWQDRDSGQAAVFLMDGLDVTVGSYIGGANGVDWLIVG